MITANAGRKTLRANAALVGGDYTVGRSAGKLAGRSVGSVAYTVTLPTGDEFYFNDYGKARRCAGAGDGRSLTATNTVNGESVTVWNSDLLKQVWSSLPNGKEKAALAARLFLPEWAIGNNP